MNRRTVLAFALIGLLWGSAWIPATEFVRQITALRTGALRFAVAAVFTGLLTLVLGLWSDQQARPRITSALLRHALVLSATALALPYALTVWASTHVPPGLVPALFSLMPLIALLMSGELPGDLLPALVIGISGVVLLVAQGLSFSLRQLGGTILLLCAVVLGAFSLTYVKKHLRAPDLLLSSSIQFAFGAVLLGVISFASERVHPPVMNTPAVLWLLALGILISGITLPLLYWLLTQIEPWQAALLQWISTLVAVAEAALLLRARPGPEQAVAAAAIVGSALWLLYRRESVTPRATIPTIQSPAASDSEVGSK